MDQHQATHPHRTPPAHRVFITVCLAAIYLLAPQAIFVTKIRLANRRYAEGTRLADLAARHARRDGTVYLFNGQLTEWERPRNAFEVTVSTYTSPQAPRPADPHVETIAIWHEDRFWRFAIDFRAGRPPRVRFLQDPTQPVTNPASMPPSSERPRAKP